jgi:hypothetical protein
MLSYTVDQNYVFFLNQKDQNKKSYNFFSFLIYLIKVLIKMDQIGFFKNVLVICCRENFGKYVTNDGLYMEKSPIPLTLKLIQESETEHEKRNFDRGTMSNFLFLSHKFKLKLYSQCSSI